MSVPGRKPLVFGRSFDDLRVGDMEVIQRSWSEEEVAEFARLTGDTNSFHIDDEFARRSPFRAKIVHGLLTGSLITRFGGTNFPGPGTIATWLKLEFIRPVYIGETVTAVARVVHKDPGTRRVLIEMICSNPRSEEVLRGRIEVMPPDPRFYS